MKKRVRFEFKGRTYDVEVERRGNEVYVEGEGESYTLRLLPGSVPPSGVPTAPAAAAPAAAAGQQPATPPPDAGPQAVGQQPGTQPTATSAAAGQQRQQPAAPVSAPPAGDNVLTAPMTGVIKEISVEAGHKVELGQVVVVMEAMKMDIDVQAPMAGVVAEVAVKAGDTVNAQQTLLIIDQE